MKGIRDWVFSQILSPSLASSRSLSGNGSYFHRGALNEEADARAGVANSEAPAPPSDASCSANVDQEVLPRSSLQLAANETDHLNNDIDKKEKDKLEKIENLRVKFFRVLRRFRHSQDNLLVAKVLYRVQLATSIRAGGTDMKRVRSDRARATAAEQEASGRPQLNFSIRILVLGKTGVGKSATINSIFDQMKTTTDAFQPATGRIQEVVGTVNGVKITFIDTPGFLPASTSNIRRNRKIMLSVRRYIRKSPPDIVLFFERLDLVNMGYGDFPLLKLMTEVFGGAIWFNTILVMTHASTLPEGPTGFQGSYESHVNQCANLMQHYVHQAVSDSKLENPVLLVENHPKCRKNFMGESILPNEKVWKSEFLLWCICTKILVDTNNILEFQDSIELRPPINPRVPSLPHLLSSLLQHHSVSIPGEVNHDIDAILSSEADEEDEYDQLPPIRILSKAQFERLTKSQKKDYLDELDYRELLYLKKQLKEEYRRQREKLLMEESFGDHNNSDDQQASPEAVLLPDMAVPPSFDSDCPVHRYRCLASNDQWHVRPVLDPQGWDNDVGFDGINLETSVEINRNVYALASGQMNKDKQDFSIQSECAAAYTDHKGPTYSVGVDVQSAGKDLIYTVHGDTKLGNLKHNVTECGVSLISFGGKYYIGTKLEDALVVGKRLKFVMNAGQMRGPGKMAYGGSFEATLQGGNFPMRNDRVSLSMTSLTCDKETVLGGGFQCEFQPIRGTRVAVNANLNSRKMGKVSLKVSSSEHVEIAAVAIFSILKALLHRKGNENKSSEALEMG